MFVYNLFKYKTSGLIMCNFRSISAGANSSNASSSGSPMALGSSSAVGVGSAAATSACGVASANAAAVSAMANIQNVAPHTSSPGVVGASSGGAGGMTAATVAAVAASSTNQDLASLFECPVCFDYVLPPILQVIKKTFNNWSYLIFVLGFILSWYN